MYFSETTSLNSREFLVYDSIGNIIYRIKFGHNIINPHREGFRLVKRNLEIILFGDLAKEPGLFDQPITNMGYIPLFGPMGRFIPFPHNGASPSLRSEYDCGRLEAGRISSLTGLDRIFHNFSEFSRIFWNVLEFSRIFPSLQRRRMWIFRGEFNIWPARSVPK